MLKLKGLYGGRGKVEIGEMNERVVWAACDARKGGVVAGFECMRVGPG